MNEAFAKVRRRLAHRRAEAALGAQLARVEHYLSGVPARSDDLRPVLFFNTSTRIHRLSLNAAFSLLAAWGLRAQGEPVVHLVCHAGMSQCVLGALWGRPLDHPPCGACMAYSRKLFPAGRSQALDLDPAEVERADRSLVGLGLPDLQAWEDRGWEFGALCLPSMRWVLRRHHLQDDADTRALYRRFIASAASLAAQFDRLLERTAPRALVVFNGLSYPEAVAREAARRRGIPVITHEVGLRPYSAFFSHAEATFREVPLEPGARLTPEQDAELDDYLDARRKGQFSMAGIQFWPKIQDLPQELLPAASKRELVTIFTNVAFDTSQVHANTIYSDMFAWLDDLAGVMRDRSDIPFVIRAHPDEDRAGKASRESVANWVESAGVSELPNVVFLPPSEYVSSYELIHASRLVLVYSSSIGLEASIEGTPVLSAGRARYTQSPTVILPETRQDYHRTLDEMLKTGAVTWPEARTRAARAFLYTELFRASLDLSDFLEAYPEAPGMVLLRDFDPAALTQHPVIEVLRQGMIRGAAFLTHQAIQVHDGPP